MLKLFLAHNKWSHFDQICWHMGGHAAEMKKKKKTLQNSNN